MPMDQLAARMGAGPPQGMGGPPQGGPPPGGPPMGPPGMGGPPGGDQAGRLQQLLQEAVMITIQMGPQALLEVTGPIWTGAFGALDKRLKGAMPGQGGPPGMGGPPPGMGGPPPGMGGPPQMGGPPPPGM